jgi:2-polyprenyl-3-methyl-5-hydroxy-6-metoxy-1,4-benzoquinol methylase
MPDFRQILYTHYVSRYKGESSQLEARALRSFYEWSDYKIAPLLNGVNDSASILEVGCGTGNMLKYLERIGYKHVKGIDISEEQIEIARSRGCDAELTDAFVFLQERKELVDIIFGLDFIEHFRVDELMELLRMIYERLNDGGKIILQTPNGEGLFPGQVVYGDLTHLTIFTPASLQQLLTEIGFCNYQFYETGPVEKNIQGRIRLLLWQFIKLGANAIRKVETGKSHAIWTENMICYCEKPPQSKKYTR